LSISVRRKNYDSYKDDDLKPSGLLTISEELFSEEDKDKPREMYSNKIASRISKNIPTKAYNSLERLYSDTPQRSNIIHKC